MLKLFVLLFLLFPNQINCKFPFDSDVKYMVSIRTRTPQTYFGDNHFCAGALIGKRHVLTAANCVFSANKLVMGKPRDFLILIGCPYRLKALDNVTQQIGVELIHRYDGFPMRRHFYIALLKLKREVRINENVEVIDMNTEVPYEKECKILGWGRLWKNGPYASKAVVARTRILPSDICQNLSTNFGENVICSGVLKDRNNRICEGDVGAPLICNQKLTGIATWADPCNNLHYPNVFESVSFHYDWIVEKMNGAPRALQLSLQLIILLFVMILCFGCFEIVWL